MSPRRVSCSFWKKLQGTLLFDISGRSSPTLKHSHFKRTRGCHQISSLRGILQARILEWVVMSYSMGSSRPRDQTQVSCIAGRFFTSEPPGKPCDFTVASKARWHYYDSASPQVLQATIELPLQDRLGIHIPLESELGKEEQGWETCGSLKTWKAVLSPPHILPLNKKIHLILHFDTHEAGVLPEIQSWTLRALQTWRLFC